MAGRFLQGQAEATSQRGGAHGVEVAGVRDRRGRPAARASVGAPTARYYWPCAVLREFVAIINAHRWWHVAALILPAALFYALSQR